MHDLAPHSQVYFHSHGDRTDELGNFHTVRLFPDHTAHLVAVSIGTDGWPQALSTLNFRAVGDVEEPPESLKRHVRRFRVDERRGERRLVRFVNLVFRAFGPEIEELQDAKADALAEYRRARGGEPAEDRSLEVLSRTAISLRAAVP